MEHLDFPFKKNEHVLLLPATSLGTPAPTAIIGPTSPPVPNIWAILALEIVYDAPVQQLFIIILSLAKMAKWQNGDRLVSVAGRMFLDPEQNTHRK